MAGNSCTERTAGRVREQPSCSLTRLVVLLAAPLLLPVLLLLLPSL